MSLSELYEKPFPTLMINEQYCLREHRSEDSLNFYQYYKDPAVNQFTCDNAPTSLEEAADEINYCKNLFYERKGIFWSIATKKNDQMIGSIGLYIHKIHHRAEITFDLNQKFWRQRISKNAMTVVIDYLFQHTDLHRIEAQVMEKNAASIAFLEDFGFNFEAILKSYRWFNNKPLDIALYSYIKD